MGSGRCAVRPGIQGRSGVDARQICSPESVIITELSLFPCFFSPRDIRLFHGVSSRPIGGRSAGGSGGLAGRGYLLMSMALLITSAEVARIVSLIACGSRPDL